MIKFRTFIVAWALSALLIMVTSCNDSGKVIDDPEYEYRNGGRIVLRVWLFDSRKELNEAYQKLDPGGRSMLGYAVTQRNIATREPSFCDIFVLKTPYATDQELTVWGHELKHCLEGQFHPESLDR